MFDGAGAKGARRPARAPAGAQQLVDAEEEMRSLTGRGRAGAARGRARARLKSTQAPCARLGDTQGPTAHVQASAETLAPSGTLQDQGVAGGLPAAAQAGQTVQGKKPVSRKRARAAMVVD